MPNRPATRPSRRAVAVAALTVATVVSAAACSGSIVHSYRSFSSAVDRGASCSELFDQRTRFHNAETLAKVDADLKRIGCTSPEAKRTDR